MRRAAALFIAAIAVLAWAGCVANREFLSNRGPEFRIASGVRIGLYVPKTLKFAVKGLDAPTFDRFTAELFNAIAEAGAVAGPDAFAAWELKENDFAGDTAVAVPKENAPAGLQTHLDPRFRIRLPGGGKTKDAANAPDFLFILDDAYFPEVTFSGVGDPYHPAIDAQNGAQDEISGTEIKYLLWDMRKGEVAAHGIAAMNPAWGDASEDSDKSFSGVEKDAQRCARYVVKKVFGLGPKPLPPVENPP
jgi:hypothetical protein